MPRILLAIPTVTSYHTFLAELMAELRRRSWEVHLATSLVPISGLDSYKEPVIGTAHDVRFPRGANPWAHFRAARAMRTLVERIRPDVVHAHLSASAFTTALARRKEWPPSIATIQGLVFTGSRGWRRRVFGFAEGYIARRLDETWVLSQSDVDALASFGITQKVHLQRALGFGCRLDCFDRARYSEQDIAETRRELGLTEDHFVFVFVGRQVHFKGFASTVRAFLRVRREWPNVRLLLIGARDPMHPTGLTKEEERAMDSAREILRVGWRADVARYLAVAHVNVFPSSREGMPVNLMESLAMGIPAITLDSRGCRDVVRHEVDGLVLKDASPERLREAMLRMLADPGLRQMFSRNALQVRTRFDRNAWIQEQITIYEEAMQDAESRRRPGVRKGKT